MTIVKLLKNNIKAILQRGGVLTENPHDFKI